MDPELFPGSESRSVFLSDLDPANMKEEVNNKDFYFKFRTLAGIS